MFTLNVVFASVIEQIIIHTIISYLCLIVSVDIIIVSEISLDKSGESFVGYYKKLHNKCELC